ncbi:hypothetical protein [Chitinibacter sp. GC72]|uniref:hypothetical protein n=1 Tax=Chitinibacter sp. GC72 TaxID=1526917 RepID=UPI0012FB9DC9|nr:hypothetical protein [Chitinibacter sp. GC72]
MFKANARRIVACVNALAECNIDDIEYCVENGWSPFSGNVFASRVELQRQRDELLAALIQAKELIETAVPFEGAVMRQIKAAIANAEAKP